jgi:hypothetical protein
MTCRERGLVAGDWGLEKSSQSHYPITPEGTPSSPIPKTSNVYFYLPTYR